VPLILQSLFCEEQNFHAGVVAFFGFVVVVLRAFVVVARAAGVERPATA
jgi:hypothetical protein